jgi:hypothetical protein
MNHTTAALLEGNSIPLNEELWFKLPSNSTAVNWNDFVHVPSSAGLNAESISPFSTDLTYLEPSYWENHLSLKDNSESKSPDSSAGSDSADFSPYSRIPRNIDIEAELSRQNLYKTELCRSWVESATCKYGSKCQFAHGQHEIRPVIRHPKYKTEICKTFHTNGTCPYGKRCRFVHNPAELRMSSDDSGESLPLSNETNEDEEMRQLQEQIKLANLAPDPVFYGAQSFPLPPDAGSSTGASKKGSSLPFFQKLRKQK